MKKCRSPSCEQTIMLNRSELGCLEVLCDATLGAHFPFVSVTVNGRIWPFSCIFIRKPNGMTGGCGCLNCAVPGCWEESHFPLDCEKIPKWQRKCKEDGGLSGWIKAGLAKAGEGENTDGVKACPKCGTYIEKNGAVSTSSSSAAFQTSL